MVKKFALIFGIIYAAIGILGFIPPLVTPPEIAAGAVGLDAETGHGRLLGLFPVNVWHNLVHLGVGIWGIVAAKGFPSAVFFAKANAVLFGVLFILGLIPATNTLFGLAPLYSHDIWLHLVNAVVAGYFGFGAPAREAERTEPRRV